jgi:hypothetical protein
VEICQRLDGIPLAIELAAARMVSMSPTEVRDRLDDRFRLLSGSRRGLERHQTLRHAVQWSYDLLDPDEQSLLNRCSVFAGGFDLTAAVAIVGEAQRARRAETHVTELDEYAVLDLLDALVRKSLISADRTEGSTRFTMLETIRQFAEDQLATSGTSDESRTAHARHFAGKDTELLTLWNSANQREAYAWLDVELANLRAAFRWASDRGDLDTAATIACYATFLGAGFLVYEPITWAEQLVETATDSDHRRRLAVLASAAWCYMLGRPQDALRYANAAQELLGIERYDQPPFDSVRYGLGLAQLYSGSPITAMELFQSGIAQTSDQLTLHRASVLLLLALAGHSDQAILMARDVVISAEATNNPFSLALALWGYVLAFQVTDPLDAASAARRGIVVARESGNSLQWAIHTQRLGMLEAEHGDQRAACDLFAAAINAYYDAGDTIMVRTALASVARLLHRLGRDLAAARILGFADTSFVRTNLPDRLPALHDHLRAALGSATFNELTRDGAATAPSVAIRFALDELALAREALESTQS